MISYELREIIYQFVESEITTEQLEDWLIPRLPVYVRWPETDDADLVASVELGLAELNAGILSEEDFRNVLSEELQEYWTVTEYSLESEGVYTESANQTDIWNQVLSRQGFRMPAGEHL